MSVVEGIDTSELEHVVEHDRAETERGSEGQQVRGHEHERSDQCAEQEGEHEEHEDRDSLGTTSLRSCVLASRTSRASAAGPPTSASDDTASRSVRSRDDVTAGR